MPDHERNTLRSKEATRQVLLDAGREIYLRKGLPEAIDVKLKDVLAEVGLTTGAAYQVWPKQADFQRELALYIAANYEFADPAAAIDAVSALDVESSTPHDWVIAVSNAYFPAFVAHQQFFMALQFWGVADPRAELRDAIEAGYDQTHATFVAFYNHALDTYGLRVVEPYTVDDLAVMVTGATEGLALRHRFQPDRLQTAAHHVLTATTLAIVDSYLEPVT